MSDNSMGERIRMCREAKGVSQTWLADALGVDRSTIFRYEAGLTRRIRMPIVEKIAALLDMNTTRKLLASAGYALSPSDKTDLIVQYFIEHKNYSIIDINIALDDLKLPSL